MALISSSVWARFKSLINVDAHEDFSQEDVIWLKHKGGLDRFYEDTKQDTFLDPITLKGIFSYNYFRQWAVTVQTRSGELDKQAEGLLLNKKYLEDLGYTNNLGMFDYNGDMDRFIHRGIRYKVRGDTFLAQANDEPLFILLVLQREDLSNLEPRSTPAG